MDKFTKQYKLYQFFEEIKKTIKKNIYLVSIQVILTALIFPFILENLRKAEVINSLCSVDMSTLIASSILLILQILSVSLRVFLVSRSIGERITFTNMLRITWFSAFIGQTPFGSFGADITKIFQLKFFCSRFSHSVSIVAFDRFVGTIVIGACTAISVAYYYSFFNHNLNINGNILIIILALFVIMVIFFVVNKYTYFRIKERLINLEIKIKEYVSFKISAFDFFMILLTSIFAHVSGFLALVIIISNLAQGVSIFNTLMLSPIPIFISHLPLSVGGWGVRELMVVAVYHILGINEQVSFISSIIYGLLSLVISLPGIIFFSGSFQKRN